MTIRSAGEIIRERMLDENGMRRDWMRGRLAQKVMHASDRGERLNAIQRFYRFVEPDLLAEPAHMWAHGPYMMDWLQLFTPIECALWEEMRNIGAVFYPQYPIGRFFVDFGNPVARVAIECDGKEFHRDVVADRDRQKQIEDLGWTVYRISGRDCLIDAVEIVDDEGTPTGYESPASQFVEVIARRHRLASRFECQRLEEAAN